MRAFLLVIFLFAIGPFMLAGNMEQRILAFQPLKGESLTDSVKVLLNDLALWGGDEENSMVKYLLDSVAMNPEAYFIALRHYAKTAPVDNQQWLNRCLDYAVEYDLNPYLSSVYVLKSEFYKRDQQYDSSMQFILMHRRDVLGACTVTSGFRISQIGAISAALALIPVIDCTIVADLIPING